LKKFRVSQKERLMMISAVIVSIAVILSLLYFVVLPVNAHISCDVKSGPSRSEATLIFSGNVINHGLFSNNVALNFTLRFVDILTHSDIERSKLYGLGPINAGSSVYFYQQEIVPWYWYNFTFNYRIILL